MTTSRPELILASTSPYRRELLTRLQHPFLTLAPQVDETPDPAETPLALAHRLALAKAHAVASQHPQAWTIGSDQVCDWEGRSLGKPGTPDRAAEQLAMLSGQSVVFRTAVAVVCPRLNFEACEVVSVDVRFRSLSTAQIQTYLAREPAHDCAGSAKSEGLGIALLEWVRSDDPTALIGLPLLATCRLLRQAGFEPLS
jgi:septum formation protein